LICYVYITFCYIFLTFADLMMTKSKKIRNLILSWCLLVWGISLALFSKWETFIVSFATCFAGCWMLWTLLTPQGKRQKDEMTKKAWYTALALTAQIYIFTLWVVFVANAFFNFLDWVKSSDVLLYSAYFMLFIVRWSYAYYLRHPEKTWL
jgi:hypothetical protein